MHVNNITDSNSDYHLFTLRAHVVLTLCYLCWWSFLPPASAFTLLAHVVLHSVTCTGGGGIFILYIRGPFNVYGLY